MRNLLRGANNIRHPLTHGIHQAEFTTMIHDFRDDRILSELMYKGCNLRVGYEILWVPPPFQIPLTSAPLITVTESYI
jgi:hypothetical protein